MSKYSLTHVADQELIRNLAKLTTRDCVTTADMLAHIAEVDDRKLFLPAAYESMYAYCVGELHMSQDMAYKRIRVARMARKFPAIFVGIADGRLNLSTLMVLKTYLIRSNAKELLSAAAFKTRSELELFLAQRFPRPDVPERIEAVAPPAVPSARDQTGFPGAIAQNSQDSQGFRLAPGPVDSPDGPRVLETVAPPVHPTSSVPVASPPPFPRVTPLAPERFAVQFTMDQVTHDILRQAQDLLGHRVPSGDIATVFRHALEALIAKLEKSKFAATSKPRPGQSRSKTDSRYIPAAVRRAVRERDQSRCTFVAESGRRCSARRDLEYDHIEPVATGGPTTIANLRLRCREHNQFEAERLFGAEFMAGKREDARRARAETKQRKPHLAPERVQSPLAGREPGGDEPVWAPPVPI